MNDVCCLTTGFEFFDGIEKKSDEPIAAKAGLNEEILYPANQCLRFLKELCKTPNNTHGL